MEAQYPRVANVLTWGLCPPEPERHRNIWACNRKTDFQHDAELSPPIMAIPLAEIAAQPLPACADPGTIFATSKKLRVTPAGCSPRRARLRFSVCRPPDPKLSSLAPGAPRGRPCGLAPPVSSVRRTSRPRHR